MIPSYANRTNAPQELKRISFGQLHADVLEIDGELYFYAPSLARTLEYRDAANMLRGVPDAEKRTFKVSTPTAKGGAFNADPFGAESDTCPAPNAGAEAQKGGSLNEYPFDEKTEALNLQDASFLTEPGFYRVVFRSRSPVAEPLVSWVAYDVLPSIRKTGQYHIHQISQQLGHQLRFSEMQWAWLRERPSYVDIIPLALAGYNSVQITKKLGYKTASGITARKQIEKLKALGFLPAKIKPRIKQLEERILAELAQSQEKLPQP